MGPDQGLTAAYPKAGKGLGVLKEKFSGLCALFESGTQLRLPRSVRNHPGSVIYFLCIAITNIHFAEVFQNCQVV